MLEQGYSVSIYMFHGGTSFGWMNGANTDGKGSYEPDVTSYDYDSALDESGRPTPKYFAMRDVIAKATGVTPPPVPEVAPAISVPAVQLPETASLWDNLPLAISSEQIQSMEDIGQAYGWILYRTQLKADAQRRTRARSAAQLCAGVRQQEARRHDRPPPETGPHHSSTRNSGAQLDILVENTGRVNFGKTINGERAGITKQVTIAGEQLLGWEIYPLTMTHVDKLRFAKKPCEGPCFYRGSFDTARPPTPSSTPASSPRASYG